eukprot:scaffold79730_cov70-Phaeocystis_antarctica.AAC.1
MPAPCPHPLPHPHPHLNPNPYAMQRAMQGTMPCAMHPTGGREARVAPRPDPRAAPPALRRAYDGVPLLRL